MQVSRIPRDSNSPKTLVGPDLRFSKVASASVKTGVAFADRFFFVHVAG
jgi:hypothetical protein